MPNKADRRIEELVRIYLAADTQLGLLLERAQRSGRLREARYRSRVLLQVREILLSLKLSGRPASRRAVMSSYEEGQLLARAPGEKRIVGAFGGPHRVAIDELAKALYERLDGSVATVGRSVNDVFRHETLRAATERLAHGGTLAEGAKNLERALVEKGHTAFIDRAGRRWGLSDYAEMAIHTTTRQAASQGTKNRMLQQGYDLVAISKHTHDFDICSMYDGKVFSLTGATPGYKVIDMLPPFHPRCKHVASAAAENFN